MKLCVIPGDGIGHEVVPVAVGVLQAVLPGLQLVFADAGWETFCARARPCPTRRWRRA
jgi:homoisocitrate dehydrogenase